MINDFEVEWYSKQLVAMGERPLWKLTQGDREATVYRLLWLPSFHHPVCVRIDRSDPRGSSMPGCLMATSEMNQARSLSTGGFP